MESGGQYTRGTEVEPMCDQSNTEKHDTNEKEDTEGTRASDEISHVASLHIQSLLSTSRSYAQHHHRQRRRHRPVVFDPFPRRRVQAVTTSFDAILIAHKRSLLCYQEAARHGGEADLLTSRPPPGCVWGLSDTRVDFELEDAYMATSIVLPPELWMAKDQSQQQQQQQGRPRQQLLPAERYFVMACGSDRTPHSVCVLGTASRFLLHHELHAGNKVSAMCMRMVHPCRNVRAATAQSVVVLVVSIDEIGEVVLFDVGRGAAAKLARLPPRRATSPPGGRARKSTKPDPPAGDDANDEGNEVADAMRRLVDIFDKEDQKVVEKRDGSVHSGECDESFRVKCGFATQVLVVGGPSALDAMGSHSEGAPAVATSMSLVSIFVCTTAHGGAGEPATVQVICLRVARWGRRSVVLSETVVYRDENVPDGDPVAERGLGLFAEAGREGGGQLVYIARPGLDFLVLDSWTGLAVSTVADGAVEVFPPPTGGVEERENLNIATTAATTCAVHCVLIGHRLIQEGEVSVSAMCCVALTNDGSVVLLARDSSIDVGSEEVDGRVVRDPARGVKPSEAYFLAQMLYVPPARPAVSVPNSPISSRLRTASSTPRGVLEISLLPARDQLLLRLMDGVTMLLLDFPPPAGRDGGLMSPAVSVTTAMGSVDTPAGDRADGVVEALARSMTPRKESPATTAPTAVAEGDVLGFGIARPLMAAVMGFAGWSAAEGREDVSASPTPSPSRRGEEALAAPDEGGRVAASPAPRQPTAIPPSHPREGMIVRQGGGLPSLPVEAGGSSTFPSVPPGCSKVPRRGHDVVEVPLLSKEDRTVYLRAMRTRWRAGLSHEGIDVKVVRADYAVARLEDLVEREEPQQRVRLEGDWQSMHDDLFIDFVAAGEKLGAGGVWQQGWLVKEHEPAPRHGPGSRHGRDVRHTESMAEAVRQGITSSGFLAAFQALPPLRDSMDVQYYLSHGGSVSQAFCDRLTRERLMLSIYRLRYAQAGREAVAAASVRRVVVVYQNEEVNADAATLDSPRLWTAHRSLPFDDPSGHRVDLAMWNSSACSSTEKKAEWRWDGNENWRAEKQPPQCAVENQGVNHSTMQVRKRKAVPTYLRDWCVGEWFYADRWPTREEEEEEGREGATGGGRWRAAFFSGARVRRRRCSRVRIHIPSEKTYVKLREMHRREEDQLREELGIVDESKTGNAT